MNLWVSLRKEMMEQWRTRRLLVLVIVLGVFGMISPLLAQFTPELLKAMPGGEQYAAMIPKPGMKDAVEQYMKNIGQFSLLMAIILTMGSVVQEKERGSAVLMLVKPLSRAAFLMAKFLALAIAFAAALVIAGGLGYLYTLLLFEAPPSGAWIGMNVLLWVYCLVYVAITFLGSAMVRSQAAAAGVGFGALLLLALIGAVPGWDVYLPQKLVGWGGELFYPDAAAYWPALAISLGLVAVCLVGAWLAFRRQEL